MGDSDINIMPLFHIDICMTSSRGHEMIVEMHSHKSVSLGTFNLECHLHPDSRPGEGKEREITALSLTDRLRMI